VILASAVNDEYNITAERSGAISLRAKRVISLRRSRNITKKLTVVQWFEFIRKTAVNIFFVAHSQSRASTRNSRAEVLLFYNFNLAFKVGYEHSHQKSTSFEVLSE